MPSSFPPNDSVLSPIINALASVIQQQIPNSATFYALPPDGAPDDNSFVFALNDFKILGETNGKLDIVLNFKFFHFSRKSTFSDNLAFLYSLYFPYLQVFSAWYNQDLGGLSRTVTPKSGKITQLPYSDEPRVALVIDLEVATEFNIPLT